MTDHRAQTWHSLQPDQVRALGLDVVRQLEVLKLGAVLDLAQADAMASKLDTETPQGVTEFAQLNAQMTNSAKDIETYDVRIAAILGAIPPEAVTP